MTTSDFTKSIWLWLLQEGGYWTANEIAAQNKLKVDDVFEVLSRMAVRNLIKKRKSANCRRLVYGVDGTCMVPCGMAVAEVQEP